MAGDGCSICVQQSSCASSTSYSTTGGIVAAFVHVCYTVYCMVCIVITTLSSVYQGCAHHNRSFGMLIQCQGSVDLSWSLLYRCTAQPERALLFLFLSLSFGCAASCS